MIHLRSPFLKAGLVYHWYPQYKMIGLGINISKLQGDGEIEITVEGNRKVWKVEKQKAREFIKQYKSLYYAKYATLGVIPWQICRQV